MNQRNCRLRPGFRNFAIQKFLAILERFFRDPPLQNFEQSSFLTCCIAVLYSFIAMTSWMFVGIGSGKSSFI